MARSKKASPPTIEDLIDPEAGRAAAVWRSVRVPFTWSAGAMAALAVVVAVGTTDVASTRIAALPAAVGTLVGQAPSVDPSDIGRVGGEVAALREETRRHSVERARLELRLAELERGMDDVTGSIRRGVARDDVTGSIDRAPVPRDASPARPGIVESMRQLPPPLQLDPRVMNERPASVPAPQPAAPGALTIATRTQFGVDLGVEPTLAGLRARWQRHVERHGPLIGTLDAVVTVRETQSGQPVLHLVAGPIADVAEAAALCARLRGQGAPSCQPTSYDGQRLAGQ